jgi:branched-subunit amino acid aminotransferase/4-amino-4-deoxychorismate lyase
MSNLKLDIFSKEIAFGLTPFETIYFDNWNPHFLKEHYKRLKRASKALKILFNYSFQNFEQEIIFFLKNQCEKCGVLKVVVLDDKLHLNIRKPSYTREKYLEGFKFTISKALRDERNLLNYFKTFNYGNNYIEDNRAKDRGYDGALFLNSKNQVCETSYANIFFRRGKNLYTPHLSCGMLKGIIRGEVIKFGRANGFIVEKTLLSIEDLSGFDECFITNSVAGVFPVTSIGEIKFSNNNFSRLISDEKFFKRQWN